MFLTLGPDRHSQFEHGCKRVWLWNMFVVFAVFAEGTWGDAGGTFGGHGGCVRRLLVALGFGSREDPSGSKRCAYVNACGNALACHLDIENFFVHGCPCGSDFT